jgi:hypothetical protein
MCALANRFLFVASSLLLVVLSGPCCAFNRAAHMLSGALAYNELAKSHPEVIAKVMALMKSHPQAAQFDAEVARFSSDRHRAQVLFMYMARWADDVSGQSAYEHPTWHYVNIPYVPSDAVDRSNQAPLAADNILSALSTNAGIARDPHGSEADRAVALCWIFHLLGDLHQPLHVVSMITPELPNGDRGGNLIYVQPALAQPPMRLHAFWDDAASSNNEPSAVVELARRLMRQSNLQRGALSELQQRPYANELSFERWAREESYPLAVRVAYQGGSLAAAYSEDRAVVLSSFYVASAEECAVRRIVLAGYRLADVLTMLFR